MQTPSKSKNQTAALEPRATDQMTNQQHLHSSELPAMLLHDDPVSIYSEAQNYSLSEDCIPRSFMVRSHRAECAAASRLTVLYLSCLY